MTIRTLKENAYKVLEHPGIYKRIKSVRGCPYNIAEPILKLMTHHQLLLVEENTPHLDLYTQGLWRLHTLKQFPSIADSHEIDGDAALDADWRATFEDMQQERRERELAAREKLKANYGKIADGKSERSIQVIKRPPPAPPGSARARATGLVSAKTALGLRAPTKAAGGSIMSKAMKGAMSSTTRAAGKPSRSSPASVPQAVRPKASIQSPSAQTPSPFKKALPKMDVNTRQSKFLTPSTRR